MAKVCGKKTDLRQLSVKRSFYFLTLQPKDTGKLRNAGFTVPVNE
jgi:hypothetical protein